jgi:hypothetical protein
MAFPYDAQTEYVRTPLEAFAGHRYATDAVRDELMSGMVVSVADVSQVTTAQVAFSTTDVLGLYIDGALYITTSDTSNDITGDAWITTNGQALVDNGTLSILPTNDGAGLITLTFADALPHTVTSYSPATADFTPITDTVDAVTTEEIVWGQGVCLNEDYPDLISEHSMAIRLPSSGSDVLKGVLAYTAVNNYPSGLSSQIGAGSAGVMPGIMLQCVRKGRVIVEIVGAMPDKGASVYWINGSTDPDEIGRFSADAAGGDADLVEGSFVESVIPGRNLAKVFFGKSLV